MKSVFFAALAAIVLSSSAHAENPNLVKNGDFTALTNGVGELDRNTSAIDWITTSYNFVVHDATNADGGKSIGLWNNTNAGNGWNGMTKSGTGNFLALDGDYFTGPISQTVTGLTPGANYRLLFNYAFGQQSGYNGDTVQSITATVGNTSWTTGNIAVPEHSFTGWQSGELYFTADSASEVLSFLAYGNVPVPPFAMVSDVSITKSIPEAHVWAMMILGLGAIGVTMRRRRTAMPIAA